MTARVGVLVVHGMGRQEEGYADGLIGRLRRRLGADADAFAFEPCWWAPVVQRHQDVIWTRMTEGGSRMRFRGVREWIVAALGDPTSYLAGFFRTDRPVYGDVHGCVRSSLERLAARIGTGGRRETIPPLVVLAHSLGSVIVSNYVWDEQHGQGVGGTAFERMETLVALVTYGSTLPLFVPPREPVECIRLPSPLLPEAYRTAASWTNVYDPDDVLGYPLADIWTQTHGTRIEDVTLDAGWWPVGATPFSHTQYERDADFLNRVERTLREVLAVAPDAA